MSLVKYIEKYGTPDAVFFSFEKRKHYAVWGFDDIYSISKDEIDNDNILNPGEEFQITFTISNNSFYLDSNNIIGELLNSNGISFEQNTLDFGSVNIGENLN